MNKDLKICVVGLGYVGLPLAVEFGKKYKSVGFDVNKERILELKNGYDNTNELSNKEISDAKYLKLEFSADKIKDSNVYIITVPTPIDKNNNPDLTPLKNASECVAKFLKKEDIVIYESTVFPGCTEEICIPILEKISGLKYNESFFCGYSPERINPGDSVHSLTSVIKVTSGSNNDVADFVDELYSSIIGAGTYKAASIKVAEAAKVIENTQRDVNIALMNELAVLFNKIEVDTNDVLDAASTKWNFLPYKPGLVGGHCIGVDPYYLTHKASEVGHHAEIILAGRKINDGMGKYVAEKTISEITKQGINPIKSRIAILGLAFKENCPDIRNTKVISLIDQILKYNCRVVISDDIVSKKLAKIKYDIDLVSTNSISKQDAIILAVGHDCYKNFTIKDFVRMIKPGGVLIDVKSIYNKSAFYGQDIAHWRL